MRALLVIDLQNDYFPEGKFPLWQAHAVLENVIQACHAAKKRGDLIVFIQHVARIGQLSPFFLPNTGGAQIHPLLLDEFEQAEIVVKHEADSFIGTRLAEVLAANEVKELLLCGMMTQNCVTHTALSEFSGNYQLRVLADCCTTVNEVLHLIALHALSPRVKVCNWQDCYPEA